MGDVKGGTEYRGYVWNVEGDGRCRRGTFEVLLGAVWDTSGG